MPDARWKTFYGAKARKAIRKMDRTVQLRIKTFVEDRLAFHDNPRILGEAMQGRKYKNVWRYRVGHYRILAEIDDESVTILVVDAGHRSSIYG